MSDTTVLNYSDPLAEIKLDNATEGLKPHFVKMLRNLYERSAENAIQVSNFLCAAKVESNFSIGYRKNYLFVLCKLSNHHNHLRYTQMSRSDVISFLDSYRKLEAADPLHKWIGTYNLYTVLLTKFFKWLYYSDINANKRQKPEVVQNIPRLKRKEQSIYKPTDLWTSEDDLLFLRYCPSKRDKCYHMISRDTSCRPHEILTLRIKDVNFKTVNNRQYAEVLVNGKTGTRHIPLINSLPYLKDWLEDHPHSGNPNSPLICGYKRSIGRFISSHTLNKIYHLYQKGLFTKLASKNRPDISPEEKQKIRDLLGKPWNPYIRRHSALTEKSKILKEHVLRQHAGWSGRSQMHLKYLHYWGNESSESILEAHGIVTKSQEAFDKLASKQCPNCNEPNKLDSKFCAKCRMVLSYDAYSDTIEERNQKNSELLALQDKHDRELKLLRQEMEIKFDKILAKIDVKKLS
jgi:integrase